MIVLKKAALLSLITISFVLGAAVNSVAQDRQRVVTTSSSRPLNQPIPPSAESKPLVTSQTSSRPTSPILTNDIVVAEPSKPLVKKTAAVAPSYGMASISSGKVVYGGGTSSLIMRGIQARLGIPYLYGSTGPNRYDCSGFVWSVFRDAGISFTRASARSLWSASIPVDGDERYRFGTLVFLNGLGHMGIVADENGFYHASSSKGITYSPFKGYWEKRVVGFRRLPVAPQATAVE